MQFENSNYSIEFDKENGAITSLISKNKQFVGKRMPLFEVCLCDGNGRLRFTSDSAGRFSIKKVKDTLVLEYGNFESVDISVTVCAKLVDRIEWSVFYENKTGKAVEWISFPQIAVPNDLVKQGGSGRIALDINEGVVCEDIEAKERLFGSMMPDYPSRGLYSIFPAVVESQFITYYDDTAGIYIAADDDSRSVKGIDYIPVGEAIHLRFLLYPGLYASQAHCKIPYSILFNFFCGDWHDATDIYRVWFESSLPENLCALKDENSLPEWYKNTFIVVTYPVCGIHDMDDPVPNKLFPYNNALPFIEKISDAVGCPVMALLMHWESTAPWAPPYVWPPVGGEQMFSDFAQKLHKNNNLLGVYCSGTGYTIHSNLNGYSNEEKIKREHLEKYMCAPADGSYPKSNICQGQRKSFDMCISQEFAKNTLCTEAEKIAGAGVDYIQLFDQNHGGTPYFCYSSEHGHAPVPGEWLVENMISLLKRLKKTLGNDVVLGCESAASEAYLPYLRMSDNRFNLNYNFGGAYCKSLSTEKIAYLRTKLYIVGL